MKRYHQPITDPEMLMVIMQIANLRLHASYREAEARRRELGPKGAAIMASEPQTSPDYAALRLLVGTWNKIAIFVERFSDKQLKEFFRCHPIGQTWRVLEPGIDVIRDIKRVVPEPVDPQNYARELEALAKEYDEWTKSPEGSDYRTIEQQAVCADFG